MCSIILQSEKKLLFEKERNRFAEYTGIFKFNNDNDVQTLETL